MKDSWTDVRILCSTIILLLAVCLIGQVVGWYFVGKTIVEVHETRAVVRQNSEVVLRNEQKMNGAMLKLEEIQKERRQ